MKRLLLLTLVVGVASAIGLIAPAKDDAGYVDLFNGKDLAGWVNVNGDPSTFYVKDGMIVTTGRPTGFLRTEKQYENFVMEFDWMHQNKEKVGNSGLFVWGDPIPAVGTGYTRGIEVQVLVNLNVKDSYTSHGDLFSIWGAVCKPDRPHPKGWARCLPSEWLAKGGGEWNHYKVIGNNGVIKLEVNGKEVSGVSECNPRKGYLALESEGAECWFKNIKIKELPSTNPSPAETANVDQGFKTLYHGLNLKGWKVEPGSEGHWTARDTVLAYDGKSDAKVKHLWTDKSYGDFELVVDWRLPRKAKDGKDAGNSGIYLRGHEKAQVNISTDPVGSGELVDYRKDASAPAALREAATPKVRADADAGKWNRFLITAKGKNVSVKLNGKTVIDNIQLDDLPASGPIGLQHHGDPIEFANLFIRELK